MEIPKELDVNLKAFPALSVSGYRSLIRRFPVTILLGLQQLGLVLVPALVYDNPHTKLLVSITGLALFVSITTEALLDVLKSGPRAATEILPLKPIPVVPVWIFLGISLTIDTLSAIGGTRSYSVQLGSEARAGWTVFLTPFSTWSLVATVMVLWLWKTRRIKPMTAIMAVLLVCFLKVGLGLTNGMVGSSAAFVLAIVIAALWLELIRFRWFVIIVALGVGSWPKLAEYRNKLRSEVVGYSFDSTDPFSRLRLDEQMASVAVLIPRPAILEPPSWLTVMRTGLVPSVLDSNRPPIDVGSRFSVALGGSALNSTSATLLGNVVILTGWIGLAAFMVVIAAILALLLRGRNVWFISFAAVVYLDGLSFSTTYPISVIRVLQSLESMLVMGTLFWLLSAVLARTGRSTATRFGASLERAV